MLVYRKVSIERQIKTAYDFHEQYYSGRDSFSEAFLAINLLRPRSQPGTGQSVKADWTTDIGGAGSVAEHD
jgi:hypothetical protein